MAKARRARNALGVPTDVLAGNPGAGIFAVEGVQVGQVPLQDGVDLGGSRRRQQRSGRQVMLDLAKQPRPALSGAADHQAIGAGLPQHLAGLLRRVDVAVGDHRNADQALTDAMVSYSARRDIGRRACGRGCDGAHPQSSAI